MSGDLCCPWLFELVFHEIAKINKRKKSLFWQNDPSRKLVNTSSAVWISNYLCSPSVTCSQELSSILVLLDPLTRLSPIIWSMLYSYSVSIKVQYEEEKVIENQYPRRNIRWQNYNYSEGWTKLKIGNRERSSKLVYQTCILPLGNEYTYSSRCSTICIILVCLCKSTFVRLCYW